MDIKRTIKANGLTVKEVAEKMGITPVGLSQHINGNPSVEVLERIAAAIGCNVGDFSPLNRRTQSPARIAANLSK